MLFTKASVQSVLLFTAQVLSNPLPRSTVEVGSPLLFKLASDTTPVDFPVEIVKEVIVARRDGFSINANDEQIRALGVHNVERRTKGLPDLVWDYDLEAQAYAYAQKMARDNKFEHSPGDSRPNQGENLAMMSIQGHHDPNIDATNMWLNERGNYHNELIPDGDFGSYGHYTQCMWRSSQRLGMAAWDDGRGNFWVVARYSPPGNWVGQRPY